MDGEEHYTDAELEEAAGEISPQYEAVVLRRAFEIVRNRLRMTKAQFARALGISQKNLSLRIHHCESISPGPALRWYLLLVYTLEEHALPGTKW